MTPRSDLHQLIHSMTAHERRYFRLSAATQEGNGKKNYLRLFDAILAQEEYREEEIKQQFAGEAIGKNLAVEKHYLYSLLLRTLRNFNMRKRKDLQLREMIDGIEVLAAKGLDQPAWNLLKRAKKLAIKLELFPQQAEILVLERRLRKSIADRSSMAELTALDEESQSLKDAIGNELRLHLLYDRFSEIASRSYNWSKTQRVEALEELLLDPILKTAESGRGTLQEKSLILQILGTTAFLKGEYASSLENYEQIVDLWRSAPYTIARFPWRFLRILGNYLAGLDLTGQFDRMLPVIEEIKKMRQQLAVQASAEDLNMYHYELRHAMGKRMMPKVVSISDQLGGFIKEFEAEIKPGLRLANAYNLCVGYLVSGHYQKALQWTNYIIAIPPTPQRMTLQHVARIYQLVIHYELGNYDLLEYLIRNSKAYLQRKGALDRFELGTLEAMKRMLGAVDQKEKAGIVLALERTLREEGVFGLPGTEELLLWAKAARTGRPIMTIAQEKEEDPTGNAQ